MSVLSAARPHDRDNKRLRMCNIGDEKGRQKSPSVLLGDMESMVLYLCIPTSTSTGKEGELIQGKVGKKGRWKNEEEEGRGIVRGYQMMG